MPTLPTQLRRPWTDVETQSQVFNESHLLIFKLSTGDLKRVESLSTEDFIRSAKSSPEVKIDQSTVTAIEPCNDRGTVIITFSVGKDKVQVRTSYMSIQGCLKIWTEHSTLILLISISIEVAQPKFQDFYN